MWAALIPAIIGGVETIAGADKAGTSVNSTPPEYRIPQNEINNQNIAENNASQGLSESAKQALNAGANRGLSSAISAIGKNGGDINSIGASFGQYNNDIEKMALMENQAKMQNLAALMRQNDTMASYLDKQYQVNQYAPWANQQQAAAQQRAQGQQMEWQGIGQIGSGLAGGLSNLNQQNAINNVWQKQNGQSAFGNTQNTPIAPNNYYSATPSPAIPQGMTYNPATGTYRPAMNVSNVDQSVQQQLLKLAGII